MGVGVGVGVHGAWAEPVEFFAAFAMGWTLLAKKGCAVPYT